MAANRVDDADVPRLATPRSRRLTTIAIGALASGAMLLAGPVEAGANVIYNPSFGRGLVGWHTGVISRGIYPGYPHVSVLRTPAEPVLKCERAQKHHPYLQFDVPGGSSGYVEQSIIVPVRPGRLSFRTWGDLEAVQATISIVNGLTVRRLLSFKPPTLRATPTSCSHLKPITKSLNLARYAGQAVGLRIQATAHGAHGTIVDFDSFMLSGR
jgi:hypothetical protein